MWPINKCLNNDALQTSLCKCFVPRKLIFILRLIALHTFNDSITIDWHFDDWKRKENSYIMELIALHCSCQISTFFNFKKISNRRNEEIYIILFVKKREHHILEWALTKLAKILKKRLNKNSFDLLLISFFYIYAQFSRKANWK